MVGNILMDTLRFNHTRTSTSHLLEELNLKEKNYLLFTLNRKALIKDEKKVDEVLTALLKVADKKTIIRPPLRDDAAKVVNKWISEHSCADSIRVVEPLSYLSFAFLAKKCVWCDYRLRVMWQKKQPLMVFLVSLLTAIPNTSKP